MSSLTRLELYCVWSGVPLFIGFINGAAVPDPVMDELFMLLVFSSVLPGN